MTATKSTAVLEQEHQLIQKVITKMAVIANRLEKGRNESVDMVQYISTFEVLRAIITFLRQFSEECHQAKEENFLFPLLEARGVPAGGCPIAVLHNEHEKGRALLVQLENAIQAFIASGACRETVVATLRELASLYKEHIWKEDYLLLPMADKILSETDHASLCEKFETLENELGAGRHRQMEQLSERLDDAPHGGRK
jgi:hemerythrin-like domain-containing protein